MADDDADTEDIVVNNPLDALDTEDVVVDKPLEEGPEPNTGI
jgi:hypothetical protein